MSVVPLSVRISDGAKIHGKSRDVPGTVNIPYGHRLTQRGRNRRGINFPSGEQSEIFDRGKSMPTKQVRFKSDARLISILPGNPETGDVETNAKDEREYNSIVRTYDFEERTNKKILGRNIRHLVNEGMASYENDIEARREKLRRMILSEEMGLTREIVDQAQQGANRRLDEARERARELRELAEKQRLATVATKRTQQYLAQCPEARTRLSVKATRETKYSNLVQITENEAKRKAEREVDGLWYGLMLREVDAMKAREIDEEKRRAAADKNAMSTIEKQIAGKLALDEEEKRIKLEEREYLTELWEMVKQEESANLAMEKEKRAKLKKDLEEQLLTAKRRLVERAREEAAVERVFRELGEAELAREKRAIGESSSRLRREIVAYLTSLKELREEEIRRENEVRTVVEASAKEFETKRDEARQKERDERARKLREVLEGREQQLRAKRVVREMENKRAEVERDLWMKESRLEAEMTAETELRRRENAIRYGQELKEQQKHVEIARQREKEENEKIRTLDLEREQEYKKLTEQLLNAPEIITPHAFKILLKECSARRDAEQKGLCYCPTPRPTPCGP